MYKRQQYSRALYKACIASGINVPHEGAILITVADMDKPEAVAIARGFEELGYTVKMCIRDSIIGTGPQTYTQS